MNRRDLAALLSALISQLLLLLLLLFPPSDPIAVSDSFSSTSRNLQLQPLFSLLHNFLSTSDIATFISLSRKRKRARIDEDDDPGSGLGGLDPFIPRDPVSFRQFFRMKASTFEWLCGLLEPLLECRDPAKSPLGLSAGTRLGIGLFRLATGADYLEISSRFRVSEVDAKFCVKHLCRVLCTNFRFWVGFPSHAELESVSSRFETLTGLPSCCGIVSCCRFKLELSKQSIAAQIVVDSSSRILSIAAGFLGNGSDSQILNSSNLCKDIEKGLLLNSSGSIKVNDVEIPQYFVGSGDYVLLPWLLLPFANPEPGSVEENFNNVHRFMRVSSSKAMASLRNWDVLNRPIREEHKIAVACIGACSILHNMLIAREDYSAFCDDLDDKELNDLKEVSLGAELVEEKAGIIRKVLATRAKKDIVV